MSWHEELTRCATGLLEEVARLHHQIDELNAQLTAAEVALSGPAITRETQELLANEIDAGPVELGEADTDANTVGAQPGSE
ncbi:hypothetical protein [Nocardia brasiliensis]|uniref:hypothetical protein n=1 Tax=Nocardia brasiliensis TaxID=37326 RepID=UPI002454CAB2|nr:hypothetical protein [Nocardia brasiliensis]